MKKNIISFFGGEKALKMGLDKWIAFSVSNASLNRIGSVIYEKNGNLIMKNIPDMEYQISTLEMKNLVGMITDKALEKWQEHNEYGVRVHLNNIDVTGIIRNMNRLPGQVWQE